MYNDRFAQLMARKLSGEASEAELKELQDYLQENPQAQDFHNILSEYWKVSPEGKVDNLQEEIHFQQILAIAEKEEPAQPETLAPATMQKHEAKVISWKILLAAASVAGILLISSYIFRNYQGRSEAPQAFVNEVEAKKGIRSYMLLPDGTQVWLNSDSKIEYQGNFNDSIREVTLTGEAYFDVVRDARRPFIVHTSDIDVRVLGTAFNIKSYPRETSIEATLIHGLIEITNIKEPTSPKVVLHPHEKLVFKKEENKPPVAADKKSRLIKPFTIAALPRHLPDTALVETSWIYNKLIFDGETFGEIALKMERWYNVKILFKNEKVASIPIHYTIVNETVEEALKAMQFIEDFTFKINGNEIEIY